MNREIEYRAWEKNLKEIIPVENIDFAIKQINVNSAWRMFHEIELMQFTGLKDKNNVEIYEGDIVRFVDFDNTGGHHGDNEHVGVVKYQSGIFEIWKSVESEYYGSDGAFILNHAWLQDDEFEVIGNIYTNPELLTK